MKNMAYQSTGFAKRLKYARRQKHLSQRALGRLAGISQRMVANYELENNFPRPDGMKRLADALCVSEAWLQYETGPVFPKVGRWITQKDRPRGMLYCDRCRKGSGWTRKALESYGLPDPRCCPWCGAVMMEEEV